MRGSGVFTKKWKAMENRKYKSLKGALRSTTLAARSLIDAKIKLSFAHVEEKQEQAELEMLDKIKQILDDLAALEVRLHRHSILYRKNRRSAGPGGT
jgi:hypothetical protein